ncbi:hypothetical protein TIFTF001_014236 [Ficus carica]|uniref:Uncharacterized protein n=1 Tax=Ficus carica TaxID=3494 RepID=A0AA88A5P4_FICCA|nr:hypothetical protein TIFTF001_014236 [Ficus carica]
MFNGRRSRVTMSPVLGGGQPMSVSVEVVTGEKQRGKGGMPTTLSTDCLIIVSPVGT